MFGRSFGVVDSETCSDSVTGDKSEGVTSVVGVTSASFETGQFESHWCPCSDAQPSAQPAMHVMETLKHHDTICKCCNL